jgi:hypothetical protein
VEGAPSSLHNSEASFRALRTEFPHFRIWREAADGVIRYTARCLNLRSRLHTVVTKDLIELGELLRDAPSRNQCDSLNTERSRDRDRQYPDPRIGRS